MSDSKTSRTFAASVAALTPDDLAPRERRTESIKLRVTTEVKEGMQHDAELLDMPLSEFLISLWEHASPRLRKHRMAGG